MRSLSKRCTYRDHRQRMVKARPEVLQARDETDRLSLLDMCGGRARCR